MEKTGWQVTAGLLAIATVGLGLGVIANKNALAEANRMLQEARDAKTPATETETITVIQREPCPFQVLPATDTNTQCRGGVLLRKKPNGWESITVNGRAATCQP
jgi:hypothetical protein